MRMITRMTALLAPGLGLLLLALLAGCSAKKSELPAAKVAAPTGEEAVKGDAAAGEDPAKPGAPSPAEAPSPKVVELPSSFSKPELTMDIGGGVTLEFVLIRPGSLMMGMPNGNSNERPVHEVKLTQPFYLGKYEVTQSQWLAVMPANPSNFEGPKLPVEQVSWEQCQTFLAKLGERQSRWKFSLPTEAQWEYACRAGNRGTHIFGESDEQLWPHAWHQQNSRETTHPVGSKKPNAWGLYDMHGNVKEWCLDGYAEYSEGAVKDPQGPTSSPYRIFRGGGWNDYSANCRATIRDFLYPVGYDDDLGLRVLAVPR